jgi:hypothetical protein
MDRRTDRDRHIREHRFRPPLNPTALEPRLPREPSNSDLDSAQSESKPECAVGSQWAPRSRIEPVGPNVRMLDLAAVDGVLRIKGPTRRVRAVPLSTEQVIRAGAWIARPL